MFQILVVEDDRHTAHLMKEVLNAAGYEVFQAGDGLEALEVMDHQHVDLILLDIMMPNMDGYEFVETVRESGDMIPVLMLTAKELRQDKIRGFKSGVDDYMVKPISFEELSMRIRALLRRAGISSSRRIELGSTILDSDEHAAYVDGVEIPLTQREFNIVFKMLSYPRKTFSRQQLMDEFWDVESTSTSRTVDVYMTKIRDKFSASKDFEIQTVHGLGYKAVPR